jgi:O-antigen/teichoic acid export membrane protein
MTGIVRSGIIYGVANVLSAGVPFLLLPVLTRALTPAQYGEVVSFYMLVAICTSVAGLGLHGAVGVRWLDSSKGDPSRYTGSAVLLVLVTTAVAAAASAMLAPRFGIELAPGVCALAAVVAGSTTLQGMRFAVWQSRERPLPAVTLQVSSAALNVSLSLIAVLALTLGGLGRIFGAVVAGLIVAGASVFLLLREGAATRGSATDVRALLRFGLPLAPHALAGALLANADRFAVAAQLGAGALGIYGAASQIGMVMGVIADASIKACTPMMYRMMSRSTTRSRLRLVAIAYMSVPFWVLLAFVLWGVFLLVGPLLLGGQYREAIALSIWFLLGGAVTGIYLNIAGLFFFTGKTEWISLATVSASVLALTIAPYAVSNSGLEGGGGTYLSAQVALLIAAWTLSRLIQPMPWSHPLLAMRVLLRGHRAFR